MSLSLSYPVFSGFLNHAKSSSTTITPSQEASGYDGDNLKIPSYSKTWRSTSIGSSVNIDLDLASVKSDIQVIIIHGVNFSNDATIRILVDSNAGFPSPEYDSTTISAFNLTRTPASGLDDSPPWGRTVVHIPSSSGVPITLVGRYMRITISDPTNTNGYLEAAYLDVSPGVQTGKPTIWNPFTNRIGPINSTISQRNHTFGFREVNEQRRRELISISDAMQGIGRFSLIPFPGDPASWVKESGLYRMASPLVEIPLPGRTWDLNITVESVIGD